MNNLKPIRDMLSPIWRPPLHDILPTKAIDVSRYLSLAGKIPDRTILIKEVFESDLIDEIWSGFEPYLTHDEIFPFLGTLGDTVICIGYGQSNKGRIYYFDFDFGCFPFDEDNLEQFLQKLIPA